MENKDREIEKLKRTVWRLAFPINNWVKIAVRFLAVLIIYSIKKSILWIFVSFFFPILSLVYLLISGGFKGVKWEDIINFYF